MALAPSGVGVKICSDNKMGNAGTFYISVLSAPECSP